MIYIFALLIVICFAVVCSLIKYRLVRFFICLAGIMGSFYLGRAIERGSQTMTSISSYGYWTWEYFEHAKVLLENDDSNELLNELSMITDASFSTLFSGNGSEYEKLISSLINNDDQVSPEDDMEGKKR